MYLFLRRKFAKCSRVWSTVTLTRIRLFEHVVVIVVVVGASATATEQVTHTTYNARHTTQSA